MSKGAEGPRGGPGARVESLGGRGSKGSIGSGVQGAGLRVQGVGDRRGPVIRGSKGQGVRVQEAGVEGPRNVYLTIIPLKLITPEGEKSFALNERKFRLEFATRKSAFACLS